MVLRKRRAYTVHVHDLLVYKGAHIKWSTRSTDYTAHKLKNGAQFMNTKLTHRSFSAHGVFTVFHTVFHTVLTTLFAAISHTILHTICTDNLSQSRARAMKAFS
jgi:hypothetical protein